MGSFGHVRDVYPLLALARTHLQQQRPHQLYNLFYIYIKVVNFCFVVQLAGCFIVLWEWELGCVRAVV